MGSTSVSTLSSRSSPSQPLLSMLGTSSIHSQHSVIIVYTDCCRHLLLVIVVVSGTKLHTSLLESVLRAPMSFFAATDTGSIINRFSQDIQLIDAELPIAFLNVCANAIVVLAQAIMILPASYWLIISYPFLFGILYAVQKYYLRTSRQLRFLDLEAKSPLYSQFLETLSGLTTIRAFGWGGELVELNDKRLDRSQKPFYLLFSVQRWLNLVLDLITCGLAIILTAVSINMRGTVSSGFAGVALYNIMTLSAAMKAAVTVWTVLETSIGAVARVKSFEETTPSEHLPEENGDVPENWPSEGVVEFSGVSASYKYVPPFHDEALSDTDSKQRGPPARAQQHLPTHQARHKGRHLRSQRQRKELPHPHHLPHD